MAGSRPVCGTGASGGSCEGCGGFTSAQTLRYPSCDRCGGSPRPFTATVPVLRLEDHRDQLTEPWVRAELPSRVRDLLARYLAAGLPEIPLAYPTDWGVEGTGPLGGLRVDVYAEVGLAWLYGVARALDPGAQGLDACVAACRACNVRKGDRLLQATSMELRRRPVAPRESTGIASAVSVAAIPIAALVDGCPLYDLEPAEPGAGFLFEDNIVGGVIPREYIKPVEAGIKEALETGVLAGYPMVDIKVSLVFGSYHDVDSSEMAFKIAGSMAFKEAARQAQPVLLEPIMEVEVVTPADFLGDVIGDLTSRRGKIGGMTQRGDAQVVAGEVPLAEMFGYSTQLRSMTQGRAVYSMQFDHYAEVPKQVAESIIAKVKG